MATKTMFGYTPLLFGEHGWQEAYGYLGSYYKTYDRARFEIDFLMREFAEKCNAWKIERVEIDADRILIGDSVIIAQSKEAPV